MKEKFFPILSLIDSLNRLHQGIGESPRFMPYPLNGALYVGGLNADLALLYALLWTSTYDYSFHLVEKESGVVLKVVYLH